MTAHLAALHAVFCEMTGRPMTYAICERRWFEWSQAGYNETDLKTVIEWLQRENRKHPDWQYSLRFSRLIGDLENFDDLRGEALAQNRNRRAPMTPREQVQEQFSPVVEQAAPANIVHIKDAILKAVNGL